MSAKFSEKQSVNALNIITALAAVMTICCVCFLTSPARRGVLPDGAVPWVEGSILKTITDVLALNFTIPTPNGFEIKDLIFGSACGFLIILTAIGCYLVHRSSQRESALAIQQDASHVPLPRPRKHLEPLRASQLLLFFFVGWSFLSALWAPDKDLAIGGSVVLLIGGTWAYVLYRGLNARSAAWVAIGMAAALVAAAALNIWYYYHRNSSLRGGYPIGNPLFFSACMIPAVMLTVVWFWEGIGKLFRSPVRAGVEIVLSLLALAVVTWAIRLSDPRGTYVGLAAGLTTLLFLAARGIKQKSAIVLACLVILACGFHFYLQPKLEARSDTVRMRLYAWRYAVELFKASPFRGLGQGAYVLSADSLAVGDVAGDPWPLNAPIGPAHNEWLETLVDLGSIGAVAVLMSLGMTLWAGCRALPKISNPRIRWILMGLLSALVALMVEECTDVALRRAGLPTIFWSLLGLTWGFIHAASSPPPVLALRRYQRLGVGAAVVVGLSILASSFWDFQAARALHTYQDHLQKHEWDEAVAEVRLAAQRRLNPERKLQARLSEARCRLQIAFEFFNQFLEKMGRLDPAAANYDTLKGMAAVLEKQAVDHARAAEQLAHELIGHAPFFWGANEIVGHANEILAYLATRRNDQAKAVEFEKESIAAYRREWQRRPFEAELALKIVQLSAQLPLHETIDLLCLPMRYDLVDARFPQVVTALSRQPGFETEFAPIVSGALSSLLNGAVGDSPASFPAEKLRIAAWVSADKKDFETARSYAKSALGLAENIRSRFPLAPAATGLELANFTFLCDPSNPQPAVDVLMQQKNRLPQAHAADSIRDVMTERLILYMLALGDEPAAANVLVDHEKLKPQDRDIRLAQAYNTLCRMLFSIPIEKRPGGFPRFLERFAELAPADPQPTLLQAGLADEMRDIDTCVEKVRESQRRGADPKQILTIMEKVAGENPGHVGARELLESLKTPATNPIPASQPDHAFP